MEQIFFLTIRQVKTSTRGILELIFDFYFLLKSHLKSVLCETMSIPK